MGRARRRKADGVTRDEIAPDDLRPGDLIAAGTPTRLAGPMGPGRHLRPGDVVTIWIEQIGELTTTVG